MKFVAGVIANAIYQESGKHETSRLRLGNPDQMQELFEEVYRKNEVPELFRYEVYRSVQNNSSVGLPSGKIILLGYGLRTTQDIPFDIEKVNKLAYDAIAEIFADSNANSISGVFIKLCQNEITNDLEYVVEMIRM